MNNQLNINIMNNLNFKTMRKIAFTVLMFFTVSLNAQIDNVIKFKGIPVDGTKSEMVSKLKQKGFTYDYTNDMFKGVFNGNNIIGFIQTYNDRVYGIRFTYDVRGYQKNIVIHMFNSLVGQYETNEKYLSYINLDRAINNIDSYIIDTDEDISFEMKKGKIYKAEYFYKFEKDPSDTTGFFQYKKEMYEKFGKTRLLEPEDRDQFLKDISTPAMYYMHRLDQDMVQFYIIEGMDFNTYNIMFDYYNRRNAPNGEDL